MQPTRTVLLGISAAIAILSAALIVRAVTLCLRAPFVANLYRELYPEAGAHHQVENTTMFVMTFPVMAAIMGAVLTNAVYRNRWPDDAKEARGVTLVAGLYVVFAIGSLVRIHAVATHFGI